MLCAVIFAAWFGGFGPALLAIILALLAFHYYLVPPINSFTWKQDLFAVGISEVPRLILFSITSLFVAFMISAQRRATETLGRSRDDLQAAVEDQKRIEAALLHSEMYLTEAQRLTGTGSFGWNVSSGEIFWSEETFRIFQHDLTAKPTLEVILQRTHPEDRALVQRTIERASQDGDSGSPKQSETVNEDHTTLPAAAGNWSDERARIEAHLDLDDASHAVLGAIVEFALLDLARGIGEVRRIIARSGAEQLHAAARARALDDRGLELAAAPELLGDRGRERVYRRGADDPDLIARARGRRRQDGNGREQRAPAVDCEGHLLPPPFLSSLRSLMKCATTLSTDHDRHRTIV
jgi:hypothetical protein